MTTLPSPRTMYVALTRRDFSYEGVFYAAVKTTGIFCRPACGAKKPKRENVEYFPSWGDALFAGYRPCERCKPLDPAGDAPPLVKKLQTMIERIPDGRLTDAALVVAGIDPSTARRQFRKYYGMTFHTYHRARWMGRVLHEVRNGESVIGAQLNQGYESASGFWRTFRKIFGEKPTAMKQGPGPYCWRNGSTHRSGRCWRSLMTMVSGSSISWIAADLNVRSVRCENGQGG